MRIKEISLQGYRNLAPINLSLGEGLQIFHGENAQGKTNFLESIYVCAMGRSMRTRSDVQMVAFDAQEGHIRLLTEDANGGNRIDVHLHKDGKKGIAVNGLAIKKLGELLGILYVVIFSPEDLELVKEGPARKRRFLDMELCQMQPVYYYDLQQYYRILKQRNHLLKKIPYQAEIADTLSVWDSQMVAYGEKIMQAREHFLQKLEQYAAKETDSLTDGRDRLSIVYKPSCKIGEFAEKLEKSLEKDILFGATQFGPQKDDVQLLVNGTDVKLYGSQGQQRTTALALRLAEVSLIEAEKGEMPVLLLDDVLSELDERRQKALMERIGKMQVILTCTGLEDALRQNTSKKHLFLVKQGTITAEEI